MSSAASRGTPRATNRSPAAKQGWAGGFEAVLRDRDHEAEPLGLGDQLRVDLAAKALDQIGVLDDLRRLGLEGSHQGAGEAEDLLSRSVSFFEHVGDRGEVEPLGLHLADQLQPRQVLGAVVADPALHLRWGDQSARLVVAHVAHGQPGRLGELVDRQPLLGLGSGHVLIISGS